MARILAVDDEASVLQTIRILLTTEGHEVVTQNDSFQAVEMLKTGKFDILITDIRMPNIDGMQLLELAHRTDPPVPSIVISAFGSEKTEQRSIELGCMAYIQKPFKIQAVLDAVHKILSKS